MISQFCRQLSSRRFTVVMTIFKLISSIYVSLSSLWTEDQIQYSHFPWRARRRCGTAWGRRRRSSWCGRGCTWPACWWRIWLEGRRHSRASRELVHSNSRSEEEEEEEGSSASKHSRKHGLSRRGRVEVWRFRRMETCSVCTSMWPR